MPINILIRMCISSVGIERDRAKIDQRPGTKRASIRELDWKFAAAFVSQSDIQGIKRARYTGAGVIVNEPHTNTARAASTESSSDEFNRLVAQVYDEMRQIARFHHHNEREALTLQTTALVHEAYERLVQQNTVSRPRSQRHLKALTSRIIRRVLIDHARQVKAQKRTPDGSGEDPLGRTVIDPTLDVDILALDVALEELAAKSPRLARTVELRFFGGMSAEEIAEEMDLSSRTVERDWQKARTYLLDLMDTGQPG
jgi:RNA polymerase sigma factor (TIGR02999 family)